MVISIDTEKAFDQTKHPFMTKTIMKVGRWNISQHNKIYLWQTHTANTILNNEKLKSFLLKSGTRQGCLLSPLLFNIVLEVLATAIRQEQDLKCIQISREEVKLLSSADDMIIYTENPKDSTQKLLELTNSTR